MNCCLSINSWQTCVFQCFLAKIVMLLLILIPIHWIYVCIRIPLCSYVRLSAYMYCGYICCEHLLLNVSCNGAQWLSVRGVMRTLCMLTQRLMSRQPSHPGWVSICGPPLRIFDPCPHPAPLLDVVVSLLSIRNIFMFVAELVVRWFFSSAPPSQLGPPALKGCHGMRRGSQI